MGREGRTKVSLATRSFLWRFQDHPAALGERQFSHGDIERRRPACVQGQEIIGRPIESKAVDSKPLARAIDGAPLEERASNYDSFPFQQKIPAQQDRKLSATARDRQDPCREYCVVVVVCSAQRLTRPQMRGGRSARREIASILWQNWLFGSGDLASGFGDSGRQFALDIEWPDRLGKLRG